MNAGLTITNAIIDDEEHELKPDDLTAEEYDRLREGLRKKREASQRVGRLRI